MLRDIKGVVPLTVDEEDLSGLTQEEQTQLTEAKERLQSCVRRYLGLEPGTVTMPKQYRVATARWVQAIEHVFYVSTGHGIEQFATGGTKLEVLNPEVKEWVTAAVNGPMRSLSGAAGQASTGPSGVSYLQRVGVSLGIDLLMDPPITAFGTTKNLAFSTDTPGSPSYSAPSRTPSTKALGTRAAGCHSFWM